MEVIPETASKVPMVPQADSPAARIARLLSIPGVKLASMMEGKANG
jgi:hypothetical protein